MQFFLFSVLFLTLPPSLSSFLLPPGLLSFALFLSHSLSLSPCAAGAAVVRSGHDDIVRLLLSQGCNPSPQDRARRMTPLHLAAMEGRGACVKVAHIDSITKTVSSSPCFRTLDVLSVFFFVEGRAEIRRVVEPLQVVLVPLRGSLSNCCKGSGCLYELAPNRCKISWCR
jgi:hypothetical protein